MPFNCKTLDDFLEQYGEELGREADAAMQPLHIPSRDSVDHLCQLGLKFYPAQNHVVAATVKVLNRQNFVNVVAEQGSGKTAMAVAIAHNHACSLQPKRWHAKNPAWVEADKSLSNVCRRFFGGYRALVMCPGHLPKKWAREIRRVLPESAKVTVIESYKDVLRLDPNAPPDGPEWWVVGKDRCKLSAGWRAAFVMRPLTETEHGRTHLLGGSAVIRRPACPSCHSHQRDKKTGNCYQQDWFERDRRTCEVCGEKLWQDVPAPRRYSPAMFIKKKLPRFFDYYVMDEVQDGRSPDSIQADAMGFLASSCKKTITLTGTIVGGKATDIRTTLYRIGAAESLVSQGLQWEDETAFVERYGRHETKIVTTGDSDGVGHRMSRGNKGSRKVQKTIKPGIMPTLFGDHLVSSCVFLTLDEVCADLPPYEEEIVPVSMTGPHATEYLRVEDALRSAIRSLMTKGMARKILGKMLQTLLAYPDYPFNWEEIGYHDDLPGNPEPIWVPVVTPENQPEDVLYPKERELISRIMSEKEQGRKVWVFTTLVDKRDSIGRLERILRDRGIRAKVLRAGEVKPINREDWIGKHGPTVDVILSHPELVKTGLDFFDGAGRYNFPTIMFFMTGYDGFTLSQASRRAWRIGQSEPCKVLYFFYSGTMQETAMTLMGRKMAACSAVSGRFSMEGLAAMAGDDEGLEMAMARALVENTTVAGEAVRAWDRVISATKPRVPATSPKPVVAATPAGTKQEIVIDLFADDMPWFTGA